MSKAGLPTPHKLLSTRVQLVAYVPDVRKRCLVQRTSQRSRTMGFKTLSLTAVGAAALVAPPTQTGTPLTVRHGIFDGVKEAFSQETTILDEDRVTPFDRWLGIDVRSDESQGQAEAFAVPDDFVDSMDESNYVFVDLPKPMGIVFEENDPGLVEFLWPPWPRAARPRPTPRKAGDQLVAVAGTTVKGADFDACLGAIEAGAATRLVFFRGAGAVALRRSARARMAEIPGARAGGASQRPNGGGGGGARFGAHLELLDVDLAAPVRVAQLEVPRTRAGLSIGYPDDAKRFLESSSLLDACKINMS